LNRSSHLIMIDDVDIRRRRAAWRAAHRGTKELDLMVGTYAAAELPAMTEAALDHFERFLAVGDPELQAWILAPVGGEGGEFADLVQAVRKFHGL
jgi:antitoxin CptB